MKTANESTLRDALYNCDEDCTSYDTNRNRTYARGVFVGIVSAIMAVSNCTFQEALQAVRPYVSERFDPLVLPDEWRKDFDMIVRHIKD